MIIIGILYEGEYDFGPLKKLVEKIFCERLSIKPEEIKFLEFCAYGPTGDKLLPACTFFMEGIILGKPQTDIIVFHSDLDYKEDARAERIKERDSYIQNHPGTHIALALPN